MGTEASKLRDSPVLLIREALGGLESLAKEFHAPDLAHRAGEAREPLDRGELWIVVVGQFKRGKSTVLNALLGQAVLPTGVAPVTSVVTHLRWAPEPRLLVTFRDGTEATAPVAEAGDFVAEAGNPGNRRDVLQVEVGIPSPLLEGGVVLVDTPGIGSLDTGATERAYAFLSRVDAAIVVLSPDPPLGEAEGSYLRALLTHTPHLLFVLNKVDLFPEEAWQEAVAFNRQELSRILGTEPDAVEVLPVSAAKAQDGNQGGIPALQERILALVRERGEEVSRDAALHRLRAVAGELRGRLQVEERAIHLSDANLADRMARLKELREELALRREEVRPILLEATRRLVGGATTSLRERAQEGKGSITRSVMTIPEEEPSTGNSALVQATSEALFQGVSQLFDQWWSDHEEEIRVQLREAMTRTAKGVDATGSTLSRWVEEELGVSLPTPPPPLDLVDSHDFYYHVQGMKPELTFDLLELLLPRRVFRWRLRRKMPRMVSQDLELNVGRIRGDLLYRAQETVRGFFAELERRALEAEEGIRTALTRALKVRAGEQEEGATELNRLMRGLQALDDTLARAGETGPVVVGKAAGNAEEPPEPRGNPW